jgi:hypothetical protein
MKKRGSTEEGKKRQRNVRLDESARKGRKNKGIGVGTGGRKEKQENKRKGRRT